MASIELDMEYEIIIKVNQDCVSLVSAPPEVSDLVDSEEYDFDGLPKEEGLYRCKVVYWFNEGYFEGFPAPGESDYGFNMVSYEKLD